MIILLKLVILLVFCVYSSYMDLKYGFIPNRVVAGVFIGGLLIDAVEWIIWGAAWIQLINVLSVIAVSVILYFLRIWAGGDCKVVAAMAVLVPIELYPISIINSVPLLLSLLAAFAFSFVYLIIDSVWCVIKRKRINHSREKQLLKIILATLYSWLCVSAYVFLFDLILDNLFGSIIDNAPYLLLIINILVVFVVTGIKVLQNVYLMVAVWAVWIIASVLSGIQLLSWKMIGVVIAIIITTLLREFIDNYNYSDIPVDSIRNGMILSLATTTMFINSRIRDLPKQSTEKLDSRLTEDEANAVIKWCKTKKVESVTIVRKTPFVIFLSLGVLCSILLGSVDYGC